MKKKFNKELLEEVGMALIKYYMMDQRIQWFGDVIRRNDNSIVKFVISWKSARNRPRI